MVLIIQLGTKWRMTVQKLYKLLKVLGLNLQLPSMRKKIHDFG